MFDLNDYYDISLTSERQKIISPTGGFGSGPIVGATYSDFYVFSVDEPVLVHFYLYGFDTFGNLDMRLAKFNSFDAADYQFIDISNSFRPSVDSIDRIIDDGFYFLEIYWGADQLSQAATWTSYRLQGWVEDVSFERNSSLHAAVGFSQHGSSFTDAVNGPSDARWYKIFDADQGGFITEGASRVLGGWVPAADLDQIDLNEGRYFVKSWGPDSGLSDFVSGNISFGNRDSFVKVGRPEVAANQDITLDQIIDGSNLADDGSVRVFVPGQQDFGFLSAEELSTETFNFGSDGTRTTIWIDTFLSGQGRSGWSRTEVTADADVAAPSETISVAGVAEDDVSAFGLG